MFFTRWCVKENIILGDTSSRVQIFLLLKMKLFPVNMIYFTLDHIGVSQIDMVDINI